MTERTELRTFIVYVENKPGVLNRIASLFRRRGYNIESLTVGHTERPGISRMTIVAGITPGAGHRVEANIYKLLNVLSVEDVTDDPTVLRSLALIKVQASDSERHALMELVRVFRTRVVDLGPDALIIEITGSERKIRALVEVLRPFRILEMVRTGEVVMTRGLAFRAASEVLPDAVQASGQQQDRPEGASPESSKALSKTAEASHSV